MSIRQIGAGAFAALFAWFVGKALDVPVWRDGFDLSAIGDRTDMAMTAFFATFWAIAAIREGRRDA